MSPPVHDGVVGLGATRWRRRHLPGAETCARLAVGGVAVYVAIDVVLVFNFLLRCALTLAAVRAISVAFPRTSPTGSLRLGLRLLGVWAIASGLLAFFPDDPVGARIDGAAAQAHLAIAFVAFIVVAVATCMLSRVLAVAPTWRSLATPLLVTAWLAVAALLLLGHAHLHVHSLGGLYEKLFLAFELAWLLMAALPLAKPAGQETSQRFETATPRAS
jgi:Protein of unknown function (DUF998)